MLDLTPAEKAIVERVVALANPLSAEQASKLAVLLRSSVGA